MGLHFFQFEDNETTGVNADAIEHFCCQLGVWSKIGCRVESVHDRGSINENCFELV